MQNTHFCRSYLGSVCIFVNIFFLKYLLVEQNWKYFTDGSLTELERSQAWGVGFPNVSRPGNKVYLTFKSSSFAEIYNSSSHRTAISFNTIIDGSWIPCAISQSRAEQSIDTSAAAGTGHLQKPLFFHECTLRSPRHQCNTLLKVLSFHPLQLHIR